MLSKNTKILFISLAFCLLNLVAVRCYRPYHNDDYFKAFRDDNLKDEVEEEFDRFKNQEGITSIEITSECRL